MLHSYRLSPSLTLSLFFPNLLYLSRSEEQINQISFSEEQITDQLREKKSRANVPDKNKNEDLYTDSINYSCKFTTV